MALVGLKYMVAAPLTEEGTDKKENTYEQGFVVGKAIKADIQINSANAYLYGDDAVAESDTSFTDGTVSIGTTQMSEDIQTKVLGHKKNEEGNEITANAADVAPYLGLGFYAPKMDNHVKKYRAIWFVKTIFAEANESMQTKQGATNFVTPEMSATIMTDAKGDWKKEETFATEAEAIAYLNKKANIQASEAV